MAATIIVGAGVAGLTLAEELARRGRHVVVLEKEAEVGGLARSFRYGEFTFDIGPHRFHTEDQGVNALLERVLGDDRVLLERRSAVWMFDRYLEWPLTASSLARLPFGVLASVGRDLLRRRAPGGESLADHVRRRYGDTLYEMFFRPYTERFVGVPCESLASDWATTGIERALIDRRLRAGDLRQLAGTLLAPRRRLRFLYPASGGIGEFARRLARLARAAGAEIATGREVTGLRIDAGGVSGVWTGGTAFDCEQLVWTGPLDALARMLGLGAPQLPFLHLVLRNYRVRGSCPIPYQWCYFSAEDVPFSRVSVPVHFHPSLAPAGHFGLCVEVTARSGASAWEDPESQNGAVVEALCRLGLVESERAIVGWQVERVADAYPIYVLGYRERVRAVRTAIESFANVRLLGRGATFWYNNMDHSIGAAIRLARELEAGSGADARSQAAIAPPAVPGSAKRAPWGAG